MLTVLRLIVILFVLVGGSDLLAIPLSGAISLKLIPNFGYLFWLVPVWGITALWLGEKLLKSRPVIGLFLGTLFAVLPILGFCEYYERSISKIDITQPMTSKDWELLRSHTSIPFASEMVRDGARITYERGDERGDERKEELLRTLSSLGIKYRV